MINIEFIRIYKGSMHMLKPTAFHEHCDGIDHTLTVIKVKGTDEIIGGYNPVSWHKKGPKYVDTAYSFIFALRSEMNILSTCKDPRMAIRNGTSVGPNFGTTDLKTCGPFTLKHNIAKEDIYDTPIRESAEDFAIQEIEVFQVQFIYT
jgi:hypothetical protein